MATPASVQRGGDALAFAGALSRDAVAALWPQALRALPGVQRFDLSMVSSVDSAGLAMLSALAGAAAGGDGIDVTGDPPGLADLRAAYRLDAALGFAS